MPATAHHILLKALAAVFSVLALSWLALAYLIPAPPSTVTLATGTKGTTFNYFGERYGERFARAGIKLALRETAGGFVNYKLLQDANSGVDIAFVAGGVGDRNAAPHLLSAGTVFPSPSWLFYAGPETIDSLPQLKGKRIAIGPEGSGARYTAELILSKANVNSKTATLLPYGGAAAVAALNDGKVDAVLINSGANAPAVAALLKNPRVRLMDFSSSAEALARNFPGLSHVQLPKGTLELDPPNPPNDITLLQIPGKVLFRDDLHPAVVQLLASTMKEEHDRAGLFQRVGEYPATDSEFPMSQIVVDYYKNGPSFLQGYLPFWTVVYAQRIIAFVVAALAILLPLFGFAPRLYAWFVHEHVRKLYRRLRIIEKTLAAGLTLPQIESLQHELADIDHAAAGIISMRNSDLYFMLRYHLDRTRSHLRELHQTAEVSRSETP